MSCLLEQFQDEMLQCKILAKKHPMFLGSKLEISIFKFVVPCDFLPFFLINVFQKKSLLLREGLQKSYIPTTLCLLICGLTSSSCGGLWPWLFLPFRQKKAFILFLPILSHFWLAVVTSVIFISNLSNFEKNPKNKNKNLNCQKKVYKLKKMSKN